MNDTNTIAQLLVLLAAQKAVEPSIWPALVPSIIAVLTGVAVWLKAAAGERKSEAAAASAEKSEKISASNAVILDKVLIDVNSGSSAMKAEIKELRGTVLTLSEGKATSDEQLKRMHATADADRIVRDRGQQSQQPTPTGDNSHVARVERAAEKTEAAAEEVTEAAEKTENAVSKLTESELSQLFNDILAERAARSKKKTP